MSTIVLSDPKFSEVSIKYPEIPRYILRKIDLSLRGLKGTARAEQLALNKGYLFDVSDSSVPARKRYLTDGLLFREGTSIGKPQFESEQTPGALPGRLRREGVVPYLVDAVDGHFFLYDGDELVDEVFYNPYPDFYDKTTSQGTPMWKVALSGPSSNLTLSPYAYCFFWKDKKPCKYCDINRQYLRVANLVKDYREGQDEKTLQDIYETVSEALKEKGRWQIFRITAGSDPRGEKQYEIETREYIKVLGAIEHAFGSTDFNGRLVGSSLPKEQWIALKNAGTKAVEPHIEVWDEELFKIICPGKNAYYGREWWMQNIYDSVEVFGRGNTCTQIVGGAELAQPYGFKTIDEAIASNLEGVEHFAQRGITTSFTVLGINKTSVFYKEGQTPAPLEYYARLVIGLRDIRRKYHLPVSFNDYRRCGHPDTSFSRIDFPEVTEFPLVG
jgi:hypothetical protein